MICLHYLLRTSIDLIKENGFTLKKKKRKKSRRYPTATITDADCVDDVALLVNKLTPAKSLLPCQEQTAGGIGFHVNANKTYMCFNREGVHLPSKGRFFKIMSWKASYFNGTSSGLLKPLKEKKRGKFGFNGIYIQVSLLNTKYTSSRTKTAVSHLLKVVST